MWPFSLCLSVCLLSFQISLPLDSFAFPPPSPAQVVFIRERPHNNSQGRLEQFLDECRRKKTSFTLEDVSECFNDDSGRILCWNCERNLQTSTARFCSLGCKFQCNQLLGEKLVSLQVSGDARRDGLQQVSE